MGERPFLEVPNRTSLGSGSRIPFPPSEAQELFPLPRTMTFFFLKKRTCCTLPAPARDPISLVRQTFALEVAEKFAR